MSNSDTSSSTNYQLCHMKILCLLCYKDDISSILEGIQSV